MAIKRSDLVNAAKEMNELMGLDPAIDIKGKPDAIVEGLIKAKELLTPEDVISDSTKVVLEALEEEEAPAPKPVKKNGKKSKPEPEPVEEEEEPEPAEDEEEPVEEESKEEEPATVDLKKVLQETRKLDALKALVAQNDEFKSLRKGIEAFVGLAGPRELKGQMLRILGGTPVKKIEPSKSEGSAVAYTDGRKRRELMEKMISEGRYTRSQIIDSIIEQYPGITKGSLQTVLTDSKNPKYNRFPKLAVEDANKIFSFQD